MITKRILVVVVLGNLILGSICAVLNYASSLDILNATMNTSYTLAAGEVGAQLEKIVTMAYETGSTARLSDPELPLEEKKEIIQQKVDYTVWLLVRS